MQLGRHLARSELPPWELATLEAAEEAEAAEAEAAEAEEEEEEEEAHAAVDATVEKCDEKRKGRDERVRKRAKGGKGAKEKKGAAMKHGASKLLGIDSKKGLTEGSPHHSVEEAKTKKETKGTKQLPAKGGYGGKRDIELEMSAEDDDYDEIHGM
jgi:hypothetical protein